SRVRKRAGEITADPSHPGHNLFQLLPSGRRYRSLFAKTSRHKNSFFPLAVSLWTANPLWDCEITLDHYNNHCTITPAIIFIYFTLHSNPTGESYCPSLLSSPLFYSPFFSLLLSALHLLSPFPFLVRLISYPSSHFNQSLPSSF